MADTLPRSSAAKLDQALRVVGLSPRELEAARLAAEGLTIEEIGSALEISARTAKQFLDGARRKLGVSKKRLLGRALREHGID